MSKAKIHYYDLGDYLNREEKLKIIADFGSVTKVSWVELEHIKTAESKTTQTIGPRRFVITATFLTACSVLSM